MTRNQPSSPSESRLSTRDLAVAGVFGALAIVLAFTPLGLIPVPNPTEAATSLHLPPFIAGIIAGIIASIIAGILSGPLVGAIVGLVLAISSWALYGASFITFADGNLLLALTAGLAGTLAAELADTLAVIAACGLILACPRIA